MIPTFRFPAFVVCLFAANFAGLVAQDQKAPEKLVLATRREPSVVPCSSAWR